MSKTIPNYLRIHRGPKRPSDLAASEPANPLDQFWDAYTEVTGWRFDPSEPAANRRAAEKSAEKADGQGSQEASGESESSTFSLRPAIASDSMMTAEDMQDAAAISQSSASRLAAAASKLTRQLEQSQEALRHQEVELAARAAVVAGSDSLGSLADKIESTLSDACVATGCVAAAVYMLDDDTRLLKARSVFGLPHERLMEPPRELKSCRGDLEAFVQGTVLIDSVDHGPLDTWNAPEGFPSAICVSVNHNDLPIGSIWLFGDSTREFGDVEAAVARLAAAQISLLLSTAAEQPTLKAASESKFAIEDIAAWQYRLLPSHQELATGWHADGMVESVANWTVGWHFWDILPDGSLMIAMAEAEDSTMAGSMHASVARAALSSHSGYRHTPSQMMQRINDTLWQTNSGDQLVSLLYARVDPETGEGEIASAGEISAMIASRYGYRPLVHGGTSPLASFIDGRCATTEFRMMPGEAMLAYTPGVSALGSKASTPFGIPAGDLSQRNHASDGSIGSLAASSKFDKTASQMVIGEAVRGAMAKQSTSPLASLRRAVAEFPMSRERAAMSLVRQAPQTP